MFFFRSCLCVFVFRCCFHSMYSSGAQCDRSWRETVKIENRNRNRERVRKKERELGNVFLFSWCWPSIGTLRFISTWLLFYDAYLPALPDNKIEYYSSNIIKCTNFSVFLCIRKKSHTTSCHTIQINSNQTNQFWWMIITRYAKMSIKMFGVFPWTEQKKKSTTTWNVIKVIDIKSNRIIESRINICARLKRILIQSYICQR